jgi:hypothetical protein
MTFEVGQVYIQNTMVHRQYDVKWTVTERTADTITIVNNPWLGSQVFTKRIQTDADGEYVTFSIIYKGRVSAINKHTKG